mmetsp:Transcript_56099/g.182019  ORF Transcript_56099/g.182019 Transcript_56099/m.182019 type:complete len:1030 (-) Transcript_56099:50-3139(-)
MRPPDTSIWNRVPGYDSEDEGSEEGREEEELRLNARRRYQECVNLLGGRWEKTPPFKFEPASAPTGPKGSRPPGCGVPSPGAYGGGSAPRYRLENIGAPVVRETLQANGLSQTQDGGWAMHWSGPGLREASYSELGENQRVNHFPGSTELTRKDRLWTHFADMAETHGEEDFDFVPRTYVLPDEVEAFLVEYERSDSLWIVKPHASSQGKGIFLLQNLEDLPMHELTVVCRYVDNPLLIQGLKFDLRVYVLVTGYDPLRAYIYREGLVRFASKQYSTETKHLKDAYRHLTNYSINKFAKNFVENAEAFADNVGHKWSFSALNKHLRCTDVDVDLMWARIMDLIVKTLLGVAPSIATKTRECASYRYNCFELYGFDVMVDDVLKPWLLEVNLSPSMSADSPLDWHIKSALLSDSFNLVGISSADRQAVNIARNRARMQRQSQAQNGGPPKPASVNRPLEKCGTDELKTLAHAFCESSRVHNFIRLHPTAATAERYADIVEHSGVLSSSQRLAKLLLTPCEDVRPLSESATGARTPTKRPSSAQSGTRVRRRCRSDSLPQGLEGGGTASGPEGSVGRSSTSGSSAPPPPALVRASSTGRLPTWQQARCGPQLARPSESPPAKAESLVKQGTPQKAWEKLKALGKKQGSRLLIMEYIARVHDTCIAVSALAWKAALTPQAVARVLALFNSLKAHCKVGATGKDTIVAALATKCRAYLEELAREVADALRDDRNAQNLMDGNAGEDADEESVGLLTSLGVSATLAALLPVELARSAKARQALAAMAGLAASDLEALLTGSHCDPELREAILPGLGPSSHEGVASPRRGSLRPKWKPRPRSFFSRHSAGASGGTLVELIALSMRIGQGGVQGADESQARRPSTPAQQQAPQRPSSAAICAARARTASAVAEAYRRVALPTPTGAGGPGAASRLAHSQSMPAGLMAPGVSARRAVTAVPEDKAQEARGLVQRHLATASPGTRATSAPRARASRAPASSPEAGSSGAESPPPSPAPLAKPAGWAAGGYPLYTDIEL